MSAVGASQPLDGGVGLPAGLEQIVHAQALVPGPQIGVIATARAARLREDQDALVVIHEALRLGEIDACRAALDGKASLAIVAALANDPPRAAGDLGDRVGPEALDDLVEGALHGRQGR